MKLIIVSILMGMAVAAAPADTAERRIPAVTDVYARMEASGDITEDSDMTLSMSDDELGDSNAGQDTEEDVKTDKSLSEADLEADLEAATLQLQEQKDLLNAQALRIDNLIGIRTTMIQDLSSSLAAANLKAAVDPNSGDIMLDSAVFFETGSAEIRQEGKDLLDRFIPVYLDVLMRDTYADYLGEIIIEGHTDSKGSYESNLKLSQNRALQVALYCLKMPSLSSAQKQQLQKILTAKGRSYADLIYVNGVEDSEASRRVEFKFSLKDAEMIEEMNRILSAN